MPVPRSIVFPFPVCRPFSRPFAKQVWHKSLWLARARCLRVQTRAVRASLAAASQYPRHVARQTLSGRDRIRPWRSMSHNLRAAKPFAISRSAMSRTGPVRATLVRLGSNAGHAVAADTSPQLAEVRGAISEFPIRRAGPTLRQRDPAVRAALLDRTKGQAHFWPNTADE